ncbi:hypothetical protein DWV57_03480 [Faecalibacterium sp. AF10-46]|nr:hypothetical protein DWV57_03480 [Faecalibacterium sp. AF10-46]
MRVRLLHTINSLALSVTYGDTLPLLSLRDIFPRPGEVFPQRERPWQRDEVCVDCQGLSLWESWQIQRI